MSCKRAQPYDRRISAHLGRLLGQSCVRQALDLDPPTPLRAKGRHDDSDSFAARRHGLQQGLDPEFLRLTVFLREKKASALIKPMSGTKTEPRHTWPTTPIWSAHCAHDATMFTQESFGGFARRAERVPSLLYNQDCCRICSWCLPSRSLSAVETTRLPCRLAQVTPLRFSTTLLFCHFLL